MGEVTSRIISHKRFIGPLKELGNRSIKQILGSIKQVLYIKLVNP